MNPETITQNLNFRALESKMYRASDLNKFFSRICGYALLRKIAFSNT